MGEAARFPFSARGRVELMRTNEEEEGRAESPSERDAGEAYLAEIAKSLAEIVSELKEVNTSLKAIARSQAQRATQKRPQQSS